MNAEEQLYRKRITSIITSISDGTINFASDVSIPRYEVVIKDLEEEDFKPLIHIFADIFNMDAYRTYGQWIFIENGDKYFIKTFNPGEEPEAEFVVDLSKPVKVYEFCNLHGLWMTEL